MLAEIRLRARARKYRHRLDPDEIGFMLGSVRSGQSAIDLGAHKGGYTYWLARAVGRAGRVVAVEPQKELADRLTALMASRPQVAVHWGAISDGTGSGTLSLRGDGSSHGASIAGFADGEVGRTVEVPTISLDDLAEHHGLDAVHFIKCDVEGHETAVFGAAHAFINRHRPVILCECEERHAADDSQGVAALLRVFEPHDYRVSFFYGGRRRPIDEFDAAEHQAYGQGEYANNFVLEPKERSTLS